MVLAYYNKRGLLLGYRGAAKKKYSVRKKRLCDLQQARQQAESANKAKSQFIAMMSHRNKNAIKCMVGLMDLLSSSGLENEATTMVRANGAISAFTLNCYQ